MVIHLHKRLKGYAEPHRTAGEEISISVDSFLGRCHWYTSGSRERLFVSVEMRKKRRHVWGKSPHLSPRQYITRADGE